MVWVHIRGWIHTKRKDTYLHRKAKLADKKNIQGTRSPNSSYPDVPADIDPKEQCTGCGSRRHLIKDCPRSDFDCHCCGKQGLRRHCCSCEDCKKSRMKSDRRAGRTHKVKGKDDDRPCEHCNTKIPHGVGQMCRALRKRVLLASDTNEGSKSTKDLKKENLKLAKKLRSRSQPPSSRSVITDDEDEADEGSDDTDESKSPRGRRKR